MRADVRSWLHRRTYSAGQWHPPALLERQRTPLDCALVDELLVIDGGSSDRAADAAAAPGARVVEVDSVLPGHGRVPGKGEALWKSLHVTRGDVVVFVDADLVEFDPRFVVGLLGPLLTDPTVGYVKALYDRPLTTSEGVVRSGDGRGHRAARPAAAQRVLAAPGRLRPAADRRVRRAPTPARGRAVPLRLRRGARPAHHLAALVGVDCLAQVDLGTRRHGHQSDAALGRMATETSPTRTLMPGASRPAPR